MKAKNKKLLKLKTWYDELNDREKNVLKEKFIREFNITDPAFYRTLRNENMPLNRALFFARYFNIAVEDLFMSPFEVKVRETEKNEKKTLSQISNTYGLVAH